MSIQRSGRVELDLFHWIDSISTPKLNNPVPFAIASQTEFNLLFDLSLYKVWLSFNIVRLVNFWKDKNNVECFLYFVSYFKALLLWPKKQLPSEASLLVYNIHYTLYMGGKGHSKKPQVVLMPRILQNAGKTSFKIEQEIKGFHWKELIMKSRWTIARLSFFHYFQKLFF